MKAILAVDAKNGIGKNGTLPWPHNKEDFAWFKQHTLGHKIVMGRGTWDDPSFPKPLRNRLNVVVSSRFIDVPDVITVASINDPFIEDAIVIGGSKLVTSLKDRIDLIYLTRFKDEFDCDTFIDIENLLNGFSIVERHELDVLAFEVWKRCNNT
jgi:dihydrofolate reductase